MAAAAVEFTDADVARLRAKADLAAESLLKNARDPVCVCVCVSVSAAVRCTSVHPLTLLISAHHSCT